RDVARLPIAEQRFHVVERCTLAFDEPRLVADRLLLLVDRAYLNTHDLGADLHVPDRVIAVRRRIAFPHRHRMRHQLAHRGLVIIVADDAARNAGRPGADTGLVDDDDAGPVRADRLAGGAQTLRQVHR